MSLRHRLLRLGIVQEVAPLRTKYPALLAHILLHGLIETLVLGGLGGKRPGAGDVLLVVCHGTDERDGLVSGKRQDLPLIAKQDKGLCRDAASLLAMRLAVGQLTGTLTVAVFVRVGKEPQSPLGLQDTAARLVDVLLADPASCKRLAKGLNEPLRHHVHIDSGFQAAG